MKNQKQQGHDRPDDAATSIYSSPRKSRPRGQTPPAVYGGDPMPSDDAVVLGFNSSGGETASPDDMVAKRVEMSRSTRHYVKFSTSGHDIGHMFNPVGLYFNADEVRRDQAKTGRSRYEYKEVPETAFRHYLTFLQSRIESFLRTAERQVLDA